MNSTLTCSNKQGVKWFLAFDCSICLCSMFENHSCLQASLSIIYTSRSLSFYLTNKSTPFAYIFVGRTKWIEKQAHSCSLSLSLSSVGMRQATENIAAEIEVINFSLSAHKWIFFSPMKNKTKWIPSKFRGHLRECKLEYLKEEKPMLVSLSVKVENCVPLFSTSQPRPLSFLSPDDETSLLLPYQWHNASLVCVCVCVVYTYYYCLCFPCWRLKQES
jgi:hypothetical protein